MQKKKGAIWLPIVKFKWHLARDPYRRFYDERDLDECAKSRAHG